MNTGLIHIGLDGEIRNSLENPALSLDDPKTWESLGLTGESTSAGVTVNQRTAMGYPALWRAVNLIAGDIGRLPFAVYKREKDGGKDIDKDHPAYKLLRRRVNPFMKSMSFKETLTYHALTRGNGYAAIIRDNAGKPREMVCLDPDNTQIVTLTDEEYGQTEIWYLTFAGNSPIRLKARDVLHIKGLSHNGLLGIDVLTLMAEALSLGIATRKWVTKFFGNGTNVSGVLLIPENYSKEKGEAVQRSWAKSTEGLTNSGKTAILKDGVKWMAIGAKPEEAAAVGLLENETMTVSNITGVPPHKLGDKSRTSYNSLEIESQAYIDDCLDRWFCEWESEADEKLLSEQEQDSESHFTEFNRNARLRTDTTARWNSYEKGRAMGYYSVNDIARKESQPTIGPDGDKRFIPMNWQELGAKPPEPKPAPAPRNGPPPNHNVRAAHRNLLTTILDAKIEIERSKVTRAASKENLKDWLPTFYAEHTTHLWNAILPICRAWEAVCGSEAVQHWQNDLASLLGAHRASLGSSENVAETVSGWSAAEFVDVLIPPPPAKGAA